jgi:hypothetical protein
MTTTSDFKPTFSVGQQVQGHVGELTGGHDDDFWIAKVVDIQPAPQSPDGYCYITHGCWRSEMVSGKITERQLYSTHLIDPKSL